MPTLLIPIIIVGIVVVVVIGIIAKKLFAPKKIANLASYVKQGKYQQATRLGKQLLQREPRNAEVHYLLGLSYINDSKPELALMEFKTVNDIGQFGRHAPESQFRKKIAELYRQFEQPEEALKEYLLLIKRDPSNPDHVYQAATLFEERDNSDRASTFYRKVIELDPRHSNAHFRLGRILYRTKHTVEAKQEFEAAVQFAGTENFQAYYYLGRILKENRDFVAALVAFEKAQRDQEIKVKALVERGSCYMSLNSLDKAVTELERAIRLVENDGSTESLYARYFLSVCYEKMRQLEDAIEQWEFIYRKKPNFRDVAEKLSQYQDLRADDHMKDFLTASHVDFVEQCKLVVSALDLGPQDVSEIPNGCQIVGVEAESKFRNTRKMPRLIWVLRVSDVIDLTTVRSMHEDMKRMNVTRGIIAAPTNYTRSAIEFAETRPIDLIDRERLQKLLRKALGAEAGSPT